MIGRRDNATSIHNIGKREYRDGMYAFRDYNWACNVCDHNCRSFEETCSYCEHEARMKPLAPWETELGHE